MDAMLRKQIIDELAIAAERQTAAIQIAIEQLQGFSSVDCQLMVDVEALDEAFGEKARPSASALGNMSWQAIRA